MKDYHLDTTDKDRISPPEQRSQLSAKENWYRYRNEAIKKIEDIKNPKATQMLQIIAVVLVKIYWELRKPK